jgi:hypothetical protein
MEEKNLLGGILGGMRIVIVPAETAQPKLNPAERDLANALLDISQKHGTFDESGCGIYASYEPGATNETQNIGVKCANCVLYAGGDRCRIISLKVEPTGKCRFAVIPDGIVKGYKP